MKDILFFSHNQKKIIEIKQIFKDSKIKVYDLNGFEKIKDPKETGVTFASNAKIKSKCGQELYKLAQIGINQIISKQKNVLE